MSNGQEKKEYAIAITTACIINVVLFLLFYQPPVQIYPNSTVTLTPYSDQTRDNGTSRFDTISIDGDFQFSYFLTDDYAWPFAGIRIESETPHNLTKFDDIILSVKVVQEQKEIVAIWAPPHESYPENVNEQPFHYSIHFYPDVNTYTIPLSNFKTPEWWLGQHHLETNDIPQDIFSEVTALGIRTGFVPEKEVDRSVTIQSIEIVKHHQKLYAIMALLFPLSILLSFFKQRVASATRKKLIVPLKELDIDQQNSNLIKVIQVIGESCDNSDMNLYMVSEKSGIPESKVSKVIKEEFGLNFKQYLNRARMEIATTLLKESELSVKEIVFKSGYTNKTHFFRVFRTFYNESPTEYRNRESKKSS